MIYPPSTYRDSVNLIARLPTLMQRYDEIIKLTDSQNPEFDLIWAIEEWMRRQLYIITAEEYGLRRYERLLNITPLPGESFEARRNHILVRWNLQDLYTFRFLIGLLEMLTDGAFEVNTNFKEYEMEIIILSGDYSILQDLAYIKRHIIPANLVVTSRNEIRINLEGFLRIGAIHTTTRHFTITQDFNAEISATSRIGSSGSAIKVIHYEI